MNLLKKTPILAGIALWGLLVVGTVFANESKGSILIRVAAYNVEFGRSTTPEQVGKMFKPFELDMIGFNEVPDGEWTAHVGKVLGMRHSYVGNISSANHKDKYKSILSRTPFEATAEHELSVERRRSWNPSSVVKVITKIDGVPVALYSLHICRSTDSDKTGHAYRLAKQVLPKEKTNRVIVLGDFNNNMGDTAMNMLEASGYKPTWKDLKIDFSKEFTYNALKPEQPNSGVIDHIFYNSGSGGSATDGGIIELNKALSDHKPVWAEIAFPKALKRLKPKN
jgi:maltose 6'-phosphate phosphatase